MQQISFEEFESYMDTGLYPLAVSDGLTDKHRGSKDIVCYIHKNCIAVLHVPKDKEKPVSIFHIESPSDKSKKIKGAGKELLDALVQKYGQSRVMRLTAQKQKNKSVDNLVDFYKQFGFKVVEELSWGISMKRLPDSSESLEENVTLEYTDTKDAYNFAKVKHDATGILRKNSKKPYFVHPEMVADVVAAYGGTVEEIEAALLQDVLEDTDTTAEGLEDTFGYRVAQIVEEVTNYGPKVEKLGKENYINQELLEISNSALLVKLADMYCNSLDKPKVGQAERMFRNLRHLLEFRPDLDDRCRRLVESFPLEE